MILLIDNYDSFVHNLARYLRRLGQETVVVRNDQITPDEALEQQPAAIVLSPGPCTPCEAGCSLELVRRASDQIPILGVCLGHQAIGAAFGANVVRAPRPKHGQRSLIEHNGQGVFSGLPNPLVVGRYHSLVIDESTLPSDLEVTARSDDGLIMAVAHRRWPVVGVQFHPESILTEGGYELLANFLKLTGVSLSQEIPTADHERAIPTKSPSLPLQPVTF